MILVYPMLTSGDVSAAALPGICKMLERFILVYRTDEVLSRIKSQSNYNLNLSGSLFRMTEDLEIDEDLGYKEWLSEIKSGDPTPVVVSNKYGSGTKAVSKKGPTAAAQGAYNPLSKKEHPIRLKLEMDSVALEPTFVHLEGTKGSKSLLGIKVIPFPVVTMSTQQLVDTIIMEKNRTKLQTMVKSYERKIIGIYYQVIRRLPIVKNFAGGLRGDPIRDIIWGASDFYRDTFLCFNYTDLEDDSLFAKVGGVKKLFKLGWSSFICADDVHRRAIFCMKEFKGLCSTVPYGFMYASLGRDKSQVYDDLTDIRKSGGPLFGRFEASKKLFEFSPLAGEKITAYRNALNEDVDLLHEDFKSFISKFSPAKLNIFKKEVDTAVKTKNTKKLDKMVAKLPSKSPEEIARICKKEAPEFTVAYRYASKVVKNSLPQLPEEMQDSAAAAIALRAAKTYKDDTGEVIQQTKKELNSVLPKVMRSIPRVLAGTAVSWAWWAIVAAILTDPFVPGVIGIILLMSGAVNSAIKHEDKRDRKLDKRGFKKEKFHGKMERDIEVARAKGPKEPIVNVYTDKE